MRDAFPRAATAIVATATHGIGEAPGQSAMELAVHASLQALGRVGLTPVDVDGLFIALPQDFLLAWGWPNTWAYARA
jgi:3-oxoacyl-[acyl-carrier-protein] synthase III